ncbi:MAG: sigma-70 family RNA polymerase sigma factor [Gammaproteobacteria bacterium]|nr:sigma-70 family RNA polymerase sigma factor [Gammaproteobacteria bacterium]
MIELLPRLRRYALTLASNEFDADDLLQVTIERALTRSHQFHSADSPDRWMFTIMSSVWKNDLRARAIRQGKGFVDPETLSHTSFESHPEGNVLYSEILEMVGRLPETQREVIVLVYVEGFKYSEAAKILNVPIGTIMSRISRARLTLGTQLGLNDMTAMEDRC